MFSLFSLKDIPKREWSLILNLENTDQRLFKYLWGLNKYIV